MRCGAAPCRVRRSGAARSEPGHVLGCVLCRLRDELRREARAGIATGKPVARRAAGRYRCARNGGRADECSRLESDRVERHRGFESLPFRGGAGARRSLCSTRHGGAASRPSPFAEFYYGVQRDGIAKLREVSASVVSAIGAVISRSTAHTPDSPNLDFSQTERYHPVCGQSADTVTPADLPVAAAGRVAGAHPRRPVDRAQPG